MGKEGKRERKVESHSYVRLFYAFKRVDKLEYAY